MRFLFGFLIGLLAGFAVASLLSQGEEGPLSGVLARMRPQA